MEFAKFLHRFRHTMLLNYFKNYFVHLDTIYQHNPRQKTKKSFHTFARTKRAKKKIAAYSGRAVEVWEKLPIELKECSYFKFKKNAQTIHPNRL